MARKPLTKKIRFEVFKRDKFVCQYCGEKAPTVVLHVDHIEPVSKGGTNEITNLITSCFECNSGKSDRVLSDGSVVEKQRKQLELIQERREQIELMFEWKKSLSQLDEEIVGMLVDYIESKISPYSVSEHGKQIIKNLLKKFDTEKILSSIDIAFNKYIKLSGNGELTRESVEDFLDKIGGVLHIQNLKPIQQKLAYIKGIAKNRCNYFDVQRASIYLNKYVKSLKDHGYSDEEIVIDLENELMPRTKEINSWTEWIKLIEGWIESIEKWKKETVTEAVEEREEYTDERLKSFVNLTIDEIEAKEKVLLHITQILPKFKVTEFTKALNEEIIAFLKILSSLDEEKLKKHRLEDQESNYLDQFTYNNNLQSFFQYEDSMDYFIFSEVNNTTDKILNDIFQTIYFPAKKYSIKEINIQVDLLLNHFQMRNLN